MSRSNHGWKIALLLAALFLYPVAARQRSLRPRTFGKPVPLTSHGKTVISISLVHSLVFTPGGKKLVVGRERPAESEGKRRGVVEVWDVRTGALQPVMARGGNDAKGVWVGDATEVAVAPGAKTVASLHSLGVLLWNIQTGQQIKDMRIEPDAGGSDFKHSSIAFLSDRKLVYAQEQQNHVMVLRHPNA